MGHFERIIDSKKIFEGRIINLRVDTVELENGKTSTREIIEHGGAVCVAPLTSDNEFIFVKQYRLPHRCEFLELPAGKLDSGENPLDCAHRELIEETGYSSDELVFMGDYVPTTAYCSEVIQLYFAQDLKYVGQNLDEDEFLTVTKIPLDTAVDMVMSGEITDGKSALLILKIKEFLKR